MAEYLIQDTTLDAIADAINAKTGGSSAMTPAEMVTEIGNISGGSLPTGMTHIGSGSFTFASRTTVTEKIYHGLDFTPMFVMIWADDSELSYNDVFYTILTNQYPNNYGTAVNQRIIMYRTSAGVSNNISAVGPYITNEYFYINHGSYSYKANTTYNWFAFA